jgi:surfeit locus 1 family protein
MAALLLASAGFVRLGVWQLSRLHQRRAANVATTAARAAPAASISAGSARADTLAQHYVVAQGRYDHAHEILLRGEVLEGAPGVDVVTPLLLTDSGHAILVNRGFVPAPDAFSAVTDGTQEPGPRTVRGLALPLGSAPGEPMVHGGRTTWRRLEAAALRQRLPYTILPIYILQTPDSSLSRFPRRLAAPAVDEGPHLSYAIQWFLFAGLAAAFAILVVGNRTIGHEGREDDRTIRR